VLTRPSEWQLIWLDIDLSVFNPNMEVMGKYQYSWFCPGLS